MANASDTANEAAVMIACFPGAKFDANMYAALTDISATAASGRYYHTFKPQATKLVAAAKSAGRLNADGTVNTAALVAPKASPRGKKSAGTLNGVKTGRVSKKSAARSKVGKDEGDSQGSEGSAGEAAEDSE